MRIQATFYDEWCSLVRDLSTQKLITFSSVVGNDLFQRLVYENKQALLSMAQHYTPFGEAF